MAIIGRSSLSTDWIVIGFLNFSRSPAALDIPERIDTLFNRVDDWFWYAMFARLNSHGTEMHGKILLRK